MSDYARQLCNELMGLDRNKTVYEEKTQEKRFYDKDVCKYFLVSFCPHDLFPNTKSDIGPCEYRTHDEALRADYMLNGEDYVVQFEKKMMDYLQRLVNDLDRRIKRAKERLEAKPSDEVLAMMKPNKDENEERIVKLELQLKDLLDRMEKFGEEGKVYEAQQLDCESDRLRRDIDRIKQEINPMFKMEKEMETCSVCGAFLVVNDIAKRLDAHYEGKQHIGFDKVRKELDRLKEKYPNTPVTSPSTQGKTAFLYELPSRRRSKSPPLRSKSPQTRGASSRDAGARLHSPERKSRNQMRQKSRSKSPIPHDYPQSRKFRKY
ncbi:splicing factor [Mitosporidium daphniae]|uniref:Luc7-like protein n=1 Tax=Mitosporidium daphniae TaxID=1485682 RepID=A0A098VVG3_9MICR|nr:uncharacterized protein DI09_28p70 [Mitosporidium daphniae]KGG51726.1 hypothetical protein DI09_28p70 [Mitosporidium daphniae]|eukprot:XP_013238178.1 uncharacterized protein DI09_28p70 [Mitosporidium daphniae]